MNKNYLFFLLIVFSSHLYADQMKVNITAKVTENTCTISSESTNFIVNMVNSNLRGEAVGIPFGREPFFINLTYCPESINFAHLIIKGESDSIMKNLLKISDIEESSASGIAIAIYDDKNNNINISNNRTDFIINSDENNYVFNFSAAYIKTRENASPGKVTAVAYFDITYD